MFLTNPLGLSVGLLAVAAAKIGGCPHIVTSVHFEARGVLVLAAADLVQLRCDGDVIIALRAANTPPARHVVPGFISGARITGSTARRGNDGARCNRGA